MLILRRREYDGRHRQRVPSLTTASLPLQLPLRVHQSRLDQESHSRVVADSIAVEKIRQRRLQIVINTVMFALLVVWQLEFVQ